MHSAENPAVNAPIFEIAKPSFMHSRILEVDSVEVYVGFPQLCPWSLGTACFETREKLAGKIDNGKRPGGREEFWFRT